MDQLDLNETGIKHRFEDELKRYNKFNRGVLGVKDKQAEYQDINLKDYAKYVLREGANEEKRELMSCFKSKIKVTKKVVTIE
jgi:peptidyl-tRNA hydrolase